MKYIWIVTRLVDNEKFGKAIPNLGVFTSRKKAESHFNNIKKDRVGRGNKCHWDNYMNIHHIHHNAGPSADYRRAYFTNDYDERETLIIERWKA